MARYDFTYACGHAGTCRLGGSQSSRRHQLARYAEELCRDCYVARRIAESKAQGEAAVAAVAARGDALAPLAGTPKQVAWAEQIRAKALLAVDKARAAAEAAAEKADPDGDPPLSAWATARRAVAEAGDAGWWCDQGREPPDLTARAALACAVMRDLNAWGGALAWEMAAGLVDPLAERLERGKPASPDHLHWRVEMFASDLRDAASRAPGRRGPRVRPSRELRNALWVMLRDELLRRLRAAGADYAAGGWGEGHPEGVPAGRLERAERLDRRAAAGENGDEP